jgi:UDP-GlcNAc:undecaprenyl-phosphate GlcNAc-1-phosphate transferase
MMNWFNLKIFSWVIVSFFLNTLTAYLWHKKLNIKVGLKHYEALQRIHLNETPRLGGFILIICLICFVIDSSEIEINYFFNTALISFLPTILISLKEDLFHDTSPIIRLLSIFFSAAIFLFLNTGPLPDMSGIPYISKIFLLPGGFFIFYMLGMVTIANGMNLIDGVNGLCGSVSVAMLSALLFLAYKSGDLILMNTIITLIFLLIPFLLLNYPFGLIFLGDLGAYTLGLIISMLTIFFFGRHPEISVWGAVLILIYPATEVFFSLIRRAYKGIAIFHPDSLHLHTKLFQFFKLRTHNKLIANSLVTPSLSILWLFPLITIGWVYHKKELIFIAIILFECIYLLIYLLLTKANVLKIKSHITN